MADLFQETERLKIRFLSAYERLLELNMMTQQEFDEVLDAIDRIDELTEEEFADKLGKFMSLEGYEGITN